MATYTGMSFCHGPASVDGKRDMSNCSPASLKIRSIIRLRGFVFSLIGLFVAFHSIGSYQISSPSGSNICIGIDILRVPIAPNDRSGGRSIPYSSQEGQAHLHGRHDCWTLGCIRSRSTMPQKLLILGLFLSVSHLRLSCLIKSYS